MKLSHATSFVFLSLSSLCFGQKAPAPLNAGLKDMNDGFVENKGQWDPRVQFLMHKPGMDMWLTKDGAIFDLKKITQKDAKSEAKVQGDVVGMSFVGSHPAKDLGLTKERGYFNYFIGNDHTKWRNHVRRFSEVRSSEIYKGIALRYYTEKGCPRYDLIVHPGADPSQVAMKFDGAQNVRVASNGTLQVKTPFGFLEEKGLVAYQRLGGKKVQVTCRMAAKNGLAEFITGKYDKSKELVIDPLIYATYYYEMGAPQACFCTTKSGNIALATTGTLNTDFPVTTGSYQSTLANYQEVILAELDGKDAGLIFGTYVGGGDSEVDYPEALAIDSNNNYVITGITDSYNFPTTKGAYSPVFSGTPNPDAYVFVSKILANGTALLDGSVLGPGVSKGISLDSNNNVWVTGAATDPTYPTSQGPAYAAGSGFVSELSADFTTLISSQFLNPVKGAASENPNNLTTTAIINDSKGGTYIAAEAINAAETPYPTSANSAYTKGSGVLLYLDPKSHQITATTDIPMTQLGNSPSPLYLAINASDEPVVAFTFYDPSVKALSNAYQVAPKNTFNAPFVAVLSPNLQKVVASTYISGGAKSPLLIPSNPGETAAGLCLDSQGNIVLLGLTTSYDFPTTTGAVLAHYPPDSTTAFPFVSKFSPDLSTLEFSSLFYGGPIIGSCIDSDDQVTVVGAPNNAGFLSTPGAFMGANAGNYGSNIEKIGLETGPTISTPVAYFTGGVPVTFTVTIPTPAPAGGTVIPLSDVTVPCMQASGFSTTVSIPESVTIPAGSKSASFTVTPASNFQTYDMAVYAEFPTGSQSAFTTVIAPVLTSITASPSTLYGGANTTVTLKMNVPAPAGFYVTVDANSPYITTLLFPAGTTSLQFVVPTKETLTNTTETILADGAFVQQVGYSDVRTTLNLLADPFTFTMGNQDCRSGSSVKGTVTLGTAAPAVGQVFTFASNDAAVAYVPKTLTCPAGAKSFSVPVLGEGVASSTVVTISATSYGMTFSSPFTVYPGKLISLTASASTAKVGQEITFQVAIDGWAPPGGAVVTLNSPGGVIIPATCTIPAGAVYGSFKGIAQVPGPTYINAFYNGGQEQTSFVITNGEGPKSLSFSSASIVGGQIISGTVTMPYVFWFPLQVDLKCSDEAVGNVPKIVTIPAGSSSVTFKIRPNSPKASTAITVSATALGASVSGNFIVTPSAG